MTIKRRNSLLFRVPFWISFFIFIMGSLATGLIYYMTYDYGIKSEEEYLTILTQAQAEKVEEIISRTEEKVNLIASNEEVVDYFKNSRETGQPRITQVLEYMEDKNYKAIYLMDKSGKTLVSTDPSFIGKNYGLRDYFKIALTGNNYVDISIGVTSGELGYYYSAPIFNGPEIAGVAVIKTDPDYLNSAISIHERADNLGVMLTDEYGVIVYSNREDKIYKSLGPLTKLDQEEIKEKKRYTDKKIEGLDYLPIQNRLNLIKGVELFRIEDEYDDENELLAAVKIGDYNFYLVVEKNLENIIGQSRRSGYYLALIVFFSAVAASAMILITLRESLKPLKEIMEGIEKISAGKYDYEIEIDTKDELGILAASINKMSKSISSSRKHIEGQIQRRTERLEKLNSLMVGREIKMAEMKKEIEKLKLELEKKKGKKKNG